MLTEPDIERRLPVWHALSDLFLDTELQQDDYNRIATVLRTSGIERAELQSILNEEVAPAFVFNLLDVAGEWCSWSAEQVRDIIVGSLRSRSGPKPLPWLKRRLFRRHLAKEWSKIQPLLETD